MDTIKLTSILIVTLVALEIQYANGQLKGGKKPKCEEDPSLDLDPWFYLDREYTDQDERVELCLRFFCNKGEVEVERRFWSDKCVKPENERERKLYREQAVMRATSPTPRPDPDAPLLLSDDQDTVDRRESRATMTTITDTTQPTTTTVKPQLEEEDEERWVDSNGKEHPYKYSDESPDELVYGDDGRHIRPVETTTTTTEAPKRSSRKPTRAPSRITTMSHSHPKRSSKNTAARSEGPAITLDGSDVVHEEESETTSQELEPSMESIEHLSPTTESTLRKRTSSPKRSIWPESGSHSGQWTQWSNLEWIILAWHIGAVFATVFSCCRILDAILRKGVNTHESRRETSGRTSNTPRQLRTLSESLA